MRFTTIWDDTADRVCKAFYEHIKHGDEKHQKWLHDEVMQKLAPVLSVEFENMYDMGQGY